MGFPGWRRGGVSACSGAPVDPWVVELPEEMAEMATNSRILARETDGQKPDGCGRKTRLSDFTYFTEWTAPLGPHVLSHAGLPAQ